MKNLLVYIDPGFLNEGGHYKNFSDKIHSQASLFNYKILHYVNIKVDEEYVKKWNLKKVFKFKAFIPESLSQVEQDEIYNDFRLHMLDIFEGMSKRKYLYKKIVLYMYTANLKHIQIISDINKEFKIKNLDIHLVLFYLDNDFCLGINKTKYEKDLNKTNELLKFQKNISLHLDSDIAIEKYQKYFTKQLSVLPLPLYFENDISKVDKMQSKDQISNKQIEIGFFGYATRKHGFDKIFNVVKQLDESKYKFLMKINLDMTKDPDMLWRVKALAGLDNVSIVKDYVENYSTLLNSCDIIILPYSKEDYPAQTSGVFLDSILYNKYVITTKETWMGKYAEKLGLGTCFTTEGDLLEKIKNYRKKPLSNKSNKSERLNFLNFYTVENFMRTISRNSNLQDATVLRKGKLDEFNKKSSELKKNRTKKPPATEFVVYPQITTKGKLADVINRLSFALPNDNRISVNIYVKQELKNIELTSLSTPPMQGRYIPDKKSIFKIFDSNIDNYLEKQRILIHDCNSLEEKYIISNADKVSIIDPEFYSYTESEVLRNLYYTALNTEEREIYLKQSLNNYEKMLKENSKKDSSYCFTTGPTFDTYKSYQFNKNSFKVICNSIIKNKEFIKYIGGADLLVFADPVFHFGVSKYGEQFRKDVLDYIRETPSYIVVPEFTVPLLSQHYPEIKKYLIGIPAKNIDNYNFPTVKNFYVKGTANILTLFMLPIASSITDKIYIFGADGRQKNETYFWKHSKSAQYKDKMNDAFIVHPSFFRDRDYEDYYETHCKLLETLLKYGEENGKEYYSLTPSYIPSFKKRFFGLSKISYGRIRGFLIKYLYKIKRKIVKKTIKCKEFLKNIEHG
jgi:hypothetical protein